MKIPQCEKIVLANSLGIKLVFCQACNVVELEIGAVSVRLCPDVVQQVANVMMKASLQLDHISLANKALQFEKTLLLKQQVIH